MIKFLKENAIFVVGSIVFIGLFAVVSEAKKIPVISASTPSSTSIPASISSGVSIDTAKIETKTKSQPVKSQSINTAVTAKISIIFYYK